jgi:hypothetical protein
MHETLGQQPVAPIRVRETDSGTNHSRRLTLSAETPRTANNFLCPQSHILAKKREKERQLDLESIIIGESPLKAGSRCQNVDGNKWVIKLLPPVYAIWL